MRATQLLHDLLDNTCQSIDKRNRKTIFAAAETLTRCKQLSIATLGRSLNRPAKVKHTIKCIDRLFGNVLSIFMVGWQQIMHSPSSFHKKELRNALDQIASSTAQWSESC
jgi:hypothetical protein